MWLVTPVTALLALAGLLMMPGSGGRPCVFIPTIIAVVLFRRVLGPEQARTLLFPGRASTRLVMPGRLNECCWTPWASRCS